MNIKILGPGCENCTKLYELTKKAVAELGIDAAIEKVSDIAAIMKYTMSTPGLVINEKLMYSGKPLPSLDQLKKLLQEDIK